MPRTGPPAPSTRLAPCTRLALPRAASPLPSSLLGALLAAPLVVATAHAQTRPPAVAAPGTGVAGSGMGQGAASITTRSDVTLAIDSDRGTSAAKLQAIGQAVGRKMGDIRACYAQATAADPTITGQLRLRVALDAGRAVPAFEVQADTLSDEGLRQCVMRVVRSVDLAGVERPAAALVSLDFANTAARGTQAVQQARAEQTAAVAVDGAGRASAAGGTGEREVGYAVSADGDGTAPEVVAAVHRALGDGLAGLLDCRRRAGRRSSPAGAITVTAEVSSSLRRATAESSTVADAAAARCVERALEALVLPPGARSGRVRIVVTFRDAEDDPPARPAAPRAPARRPARR
jgi:hypothetical protein